MFWTHNRVKGGELEVSYTRLPVVVIQICRTIQHIVDGIGPSTLDTAIDEDGTMDKRLRVFCVWGWMLNQEVECGVAFGNVDAEDIDAEVQSCQFALGGLPLVPPCCHAASALNLTRPSGIKRCFESTYASP